MRKHLRVCKDINWRTWYLQHELHIFPPLNVGKIFPHIYGWGVGIAMNFGG